MRNLTTAALVSAAALMAAPFASAEIKNAEFLDENVTIAENAAKVANFSTLLAAVDAAGLTETLMGEGPYTVFAPTDEAFAALPEGTVENLLLPENIEQLQNLLTAHVVPGIYDAAFLETAMLSPEFVSEDLNARFIDDVLTFDTVSMSDIEVMKNGSGLYVSPDNQVGINAEIIAADIKSSNGLIHVIDQVLIPAS